MFGFLSLTGPLSRLSKEFKSQFFHLFYLSAWESYLSAYDDKVVVDFVKFGWPINCDTTVLPKSTLQNHGSAAGANGERILNTYNHF